MNEDNPQTRQDEYIEKAQRLGVPFVDLRIYKPETSALQHLSGQVARTHQMLPIKRQNTAIFVAVGELTVPETLDTLFLSQGCYVRQVLAVPEDLEQAIRLSYPAEQNTGA
jgi:hypothetical protein